MQKTKRIFIQALIGLIPIIYLISIWNKLPEKVPTHYNIENVADQFGSKFELLGILIFISALSIGISLLMQNIAKIDPKKHSESSQSMLQKISWVLTIFMALISCFIVYTTENYVRSNASEISPKFILALVALFLAVLGNFMNNIKPNYFVGVRTPWTLDNEENWRRTHHFSSKIWFFGGLIMLALILFLPSKYSSYIFIFSIIPLVAIPILYSFMLFKRKQAQ